MTKPNPDSLPFVCIVLFVCTCMALFANAAIPKEVINEIEYFKESIVLAAVGGSIFFLFQKPKSTNEDQDSGKNPDEDEDEEWVDLTS